ncbi:MAG TPA: sulfur oxidation c-type cytochrome SoxX [Gammaproteobacteria bacterium]|nr:sulfur oxidation c-type cytochrome SoxX [Gammaproteobacteria bacterium]
MRKTARIILTASAVAVALGAFTTAPEPATAAEHMSVVEQGKKLAFNRKKGNCLACHQIEGGELPGNIGPPLVAMKQRFDSKEQIRNQLYNPMVKNPNSIMPPFGKHNILTNKELDKIVEFVWTL